MPYLYLVFVGISSVSVKVPINKMDLIVNDFHRFHLHSTPSPPPMFFLSIIIIDIITIIIIIITFTILIRLSKWL